MSVYLDNAATTPLAPEVLDEMLPFLSRQFGNPSSIHAFGRVTRSAIEKARKKVAEILNTPPSTIFFTSGGTEADNTAIVQGLASKGFRRAITSPIEHHAVLHTLQHLEKQGQIELVLLEVDHKGRLNLDQLFAELDRDPRVLVSLMHGNNEIGNLNPVAEIATRCRELGALFHSDTVQTLGHYAHNLSEWKVDFIAGSAHKLHGPKGVGILYVAGENRISPFMHGGAQERNIRGGTENVAGIVGLAKAMELADAGLSEHRQHIAGLKERMISGIKTSIPGVDFNGLSDQPGESLFTVLNVSLPPSSLQEMLLFNLDIKGIAASGGSACSSGSDIGSHVLTAINMDPSRSGVRFSFSRYTTEEEIDIAVKTLASFF